MSVAGPKMRSRQYLLLAAGLFLIFCFYTALDIEGGPRRPRSRDDTRPPSFVPPRSSGGDGRDGMSAEALRQPKPAPAGSHPIWHLINSAEREFEEVKARQSQTLREAVAEYRRRYGVPPPPNFDRWFEFARRNGVQLVDEFDNIHHMLTPFWGLRPATIRARAKEALGFGNTLLGVQIRGHAIAHIEGGGEWMRKALGGMIEQFLPYLPDMDLCFNVHDEPRVMVPHDDLARLVERARTASMPRAAAAGSPRNAFSARVRGLDDGTRFEEYKTTRFAIMARQPNWLHSRMSCPPDSPARALEEEDRVDERARYALGELGFVYNETAAADVCLSPSLAETYGFFDRPNAYSVAHDLLPIFSQSKVSSYADILFPSPWYWADKVPYDERKDRDWDRKTDQLYWRGSTTGGYSRYGGWRRQHRQRFVQRMNAADQAKIMVNRGGQGGPGGEGGGQGEAAAVATEPAQRWEVKEVPRGDYKDLVNVHFSHVGQCDPGDCDAQREFFAVKSRADQQDAWRYKYLLDVDGNAFSGRFYAFLRSRSLVYKLALFREWHADWLRPWAHYVPLSLRGDEWLEAVRFFGDGALGKREAERVAAAGREWAGKALRKVDLEAWFFRLLLEYGRVIDDDRDIIGFSPDSPRPPPPPSSAKEEPEEAAAAQAALPPA